MCTAQASRRRHAACCRPSARRAAPGMPAVAAPLPAQPGRVLEAPPSRLCPLPRLLLLHPLPAPAAAIDQLVTLGKKIDVPVFELGNQVPPPEIAR